MDAPQSSVRDRPAARRRGRLPDGPGLTWAAWAVAMLGAVLASVVAAAVFAVRAAVGGERSREAITEAAQSPGATWTTLIASQAVVMGVALLACRLAGARARDRLGLSPVGLGRVHSAVLIVATILPFGAGLLGASLLPSEWSQSNPGLTRMWAEGSRAQSVLWVFSIAVIPGIVEEVFYRGLVLRGFLMRWRPLTAILVSSALFAIAHLDPAHAAFTFVLGVWFGVVAWRTGSVRLTICMHAGMNGSWTAIQMIAARSPIGETATNAAVAVALGIGLVAFVWAVRILRRIGPPVSSVTPTRRSWGPRVGRAGVVAVAAAALLYAVIPPGVVPPAPARAPSPAELRAKAVSSVLCPSEGEAIVALERGGAVRIVLPPNRTGVDEAIVALDDGGTVIWLAYNSALSGKGPRVGIIEQLVPGDPTLLRIRLDRSGGGGGGGGLTAWVSLVQDQGEIDAAWARVRSEEGWSAMGRSTERR